MRGALWLDHLRCLNNATTFQLFKPLSAGSYICKYLAILIATYVLSSGAIASSTQTYTYDELGRLVRVENPTERVEIYQYDASGNRLEETTVLQPGTPAFLNLPTHSSGSHSVSWSAVAGSAIRYELYQSSNTSFTSESLAYSGVDTESSVSVSNDGVYYYRVRACSHEICGDFRMGGSGVQALLPPGVPLSLSVPASSLSGNFTISWTGSANGVVTAFQLFEAANPDFSGQLQLYDNAATSIALASRANGTYYYRVRACNASGCSGYRTANNALLVTLPPGAPSSISVPSENTTGSYSVSWGAPSGTVTSYKLYEANNSSFNGEVQVYDGNGFSALLSGRGNGQYFYRVRACNSLACGAYRTGGNSTSVTLPPGAPASISVPASSGTGSYTVSWSAASGTLTAYELYESMNPSFSNQTRVYFGLASSLGIAGRSSADYYYRVRACNGSSCSEYRTGSNAASVVLPPAHPVSISGPATSNGNYSISWSSSSGAARYELWESVYGGAYFKVHDGPGTVRSFASKSGGEYRYRAKACNIGGCSEYSPVRLVRVCNPICLD